MSILSNASTKSFIVLVRTFSIQGGVDGGIAHDLDLLDNGFTCTNLGCMEGGVIGLGSIHACFVRNEVNFLALGCRLIYLTIIYIQ